MLEQNQVNNSTRIRGNIENTRRELMKGDKKKEPKPEKDKHMDAAAKMYDKYWKKLRNWYIVRYPLCENHYKFGIIKAAEEVHHKRIISSGVDVKEMKTLTLDKLNLMSLCKQCHHQMHEIALANHLNYIDECVPPECVEW